MSFLAFLAHVFVGDKEIRYLKPGEEEPVHATTFWIQARGGWHWVSVDLLLASLFLLSVAITAASNEWSKFLHLLSVYFFVCGASWLTTVLFSRNNNKQLLTVGQWIFCFIMSGLIYAGS